LAIIRRTTLARIEIGTNGALSGAVFNKQLYDEEAGVVLSSEYHRTPFPEGVSVAMQMAGVNLHLSEMGFPAVGAGELVKVEALRQVAKHGEGDLLKIMPAVAQQLASERIQDAADLKAAVASRDEATATIAERDEEINAAQHLRALETK